MKMIAEEHFGFPPTYKLLIKSMMPKGGLEVLDLGCGAGAAGEVLNSKKQHQFTGVDLYEPYLKICRDKGYYKKAIKGDIAKLSYKDRSFDVVFLFQVIEHLDKKAAEKIIGRAVKIARKAVIVSVPNGVCHQEEYDGNIHHRHLSVWTPADLKKLGFRVYGQGFKILFGSKSYGAGLKASWWQKIIIPLSAALMPLLVFMPQLGVQLVAVKYINKND